MNIRSIVFVLLCAATFFGLNIFFSYQRDQKNREALTQMEMAEAKKKTELSQEIKERTASLSSLPLVELSSDQEGTQVEAKGISVSGGVLTLAWKQPLPQKLYSKGQELILLTKESVIDGPVLYGTQNFKHLEIAAVPKEGSYDLQLLTLPPDGSLPSVTLGEYREGTLYFPGLKPRRNAFGLYKGDSGYLPLGFYDGQGGIFVEMQQLPVLSSLHFSEPVVCKDETKEQKYFVLQNQTAQLVFTNVGGSLAEINLPFESKENHSSVVKEIDFDRDLVKEAPANARFPLHPYKTFDGEHAEGQLGGYYPLIRRGTSNQELCPDYYALNIVSDYPEMARLIYTVKEFTKDKIVFEAAQTHRKITKTYTLNTDAKAAPYIFDLEIRVEGSSKGLMLTSGVPEVEIMSNSSNPQIQYRLCRKNKCDVEKLDLPKVKEVISVSTINPDWIVNSNGYLGIVMDPLSEMGGGYKAIAIPGEQVPTRLSLLDPEYQPYKPSSYPGYAIHLPLPEKAGLTRLRIYSGPFEENTLKAVDKLYSDPTTGYNPDYLATRTFYGWFSFISEPFAKLLFVVMKFFYSITCSWGFSIILLTIFLRVLLYPLNAWSMKSMYRMREISPEVQAIQKKYKKDPKKSQAEIMALYRERKVNPFTGCLPILIQLPFLIGMFDLLKSSFQLRGASFIPGWIDNLTAPDVLFEWSRPIFFIGNQFHLLPIILGAVMFLQQKVSSPTKKDPSEMTDQERQQKAMGTIMAVVFTVMFYHFPSGLNIYWLSSMLLGILQQWFTNKMLMKQSDQKGKKTAK